MFQLYKTNTIFFVSNEKWDNRWTWFVVIVLLIFLSIFILFPFLTFVCFFKPFFCCFNFTRDWLLVIIIRVVVVIVAVVVVANIRNEFQSLLFIILSFEWAIPFVLQFGMKRVQRAPQIELNRLWKGKDSSNECIEWRRREWTHIKRLFSQYFSP